MGAIIVPALQGSQQSYKIKLAKCLDQCLGHVRSYIYKCCLCVVQSLSHVQLFVTTRTAAHQASLSLIISPSLPKLMSIQLAMPHNHLILCHILVNMRIVFRTSVIWQSLYNNSWPLFLLTTMELLDGAPPA